MSYQNGKKILPETLLAAIQQYVDGAYVYIRNICRTLGQFCDLGVPKLPRAIRYYIILVIGREGRWPSTLTQMIALWNSHPKSLTQRKLNPTLPSTSSI